MVANDTQGIAVVMRRLHRGPVLSFFAALQSGTLSDDPSSRQRPPRHYSAANNRGSEGRISSS